MFLGNAEYVARERHQAMLREVERRRLVQMAQRARPGAVRQIANWTGSYLVQWGTKLQGEAVGLPPQPDTARLTDAKCC
jgi:hypothetical protein